MTRHQFRLMGAPVLYRVDDAGRETPIALSRSTTALLAFIVVQGKDQTMSRSMLCDTLWPEAPPDKSSSSLSSAIHRLNRAVGSPSTPLLHTHHGRIGIHPAAHLSVDTWTLAKCSATLTQSAPSAWADADVAALEAAINTRTGMFLQGIDDDWVLSARQRCADIYEEALELLIHCHRQRGQVHQSISAAKQLLRHDPYREDIQAALVEMYGQTGQRRRAAHQYLSCRDLLQDELGISPSAPLRTSLQHALASFEHASETAGQRTDTERNANPAGDAADAQLLATLNNIDTNVRQLKAQLDGVRSILARHGIQAEEQIERINYSASERASLL